MLSCLSGDAPHFPAQLSSGGPCRVQAIGHLVIQTVAAATSAAISIAPTEPFV